MKSHYLTDKQEQVQCSMFAYVVYMLSVHNVQLFIPQQIYSRSYEAGLHNNWRKETLSNVEIQDTQASNKKI